MAALLSRGPAAATTACVHCHAQQKPPAALPHSSICCHVAAATATLHRLLPVTQVKAAERMRSPNIDQQSMFTGA
jgi:hypothetical protein